MQKSTLIRIDNVAVVVNDLKAAILFFQELGLELMGEAATVEGEWVGRVVGFDDVKSDIAMMRSPDGHSKLELTKFQKPAAINPGQDVPVNTLGMGRIMFTVSNLREVLARLETHGAKLVGEVVQFEDMYLLCYLRGPEGIVIALAEPLKEGL